MLAAFSPVPGRFELRELAAPRPGPGEAIVRVRGCGVCGSDLHWFHGNLPPPAVCPGHEIAGEIAAVGSGVALREGDRVAVEPLWVCRECVYCRTGNYQLCPRLEVAGIARDGGFAEQLRIPAYSLYPLPATVDFTLGPLAEPLAVCVHAVRLAGVRVGQRVLVLGSGTIGLLAILASGAAGARVAATARHPHQRELARALGAVEVFATSAQDAERCRAWAVEHPLDVVIETVGGAADTLGDAVQLVRPGGTVAVLGVFTVQPVLNAIALVLKEVRVLGSMVYGGMEGRADFAIALDLLEKHGAALRRLVTHRFPLTDIGRAFATASDKKSGAVKVIVSPD